MNTPAAGISPGNAPLSPETFGQLVNLAEDGIITVAEDQTIILFNRGAEKAFGYRAEEVIGRPLGILLPGKYAGAHPAQMRQFAASPVQSRQMGERSWVHGRRKDGTEFPAEVTISKFRNDGRLFFNAILRDVTERVRADEAIHTLNRELEARVQARTAELQETNRQLARKNEENETFVYSVSHDLRSPLVNLQGFSRELAASCDAVRRVLADPSVPADVRAKAETLLAQDITESIGYIQAAVIRLTGITDALLRLSRVGRVHYEPRTVSVAGVVDRVVQTARKTIGEKGAAVEVGPLPDAWADPMAVETTFANLIGNALNYLAPGRPGRVEVGAVAGEPGANTYFVRDNGVGIAAAYQPQIFQAFRRLHPTLAAGEGMGLITVRRVLDRVGGRIWFESAEGSGTTFYFTLPAGEAAG